MNVPFDAAKLDTLPFGQRTLRCARWRRGPLAAALLAALSACAGRAEGPTRSTVIGKDQSCPTGEVAALEGGEADGGLGELSAARAQTPLRPPKPSFTSRLLVPPETPGENVSDFTGCLSLTELTEEAGARFPAPEVTQAGPPPRDPVRVGAMGQGVVVSHDLSHACCLKGEVTSEVQGAQVVITERLSGTPCRCRCSSTLRTAVGLAPGDYTVVLRVQEGEDVREVFSGPVSVTAPQ